MITMYNRDVYNRIDGLSYREFRDLYRECEIYDRDGYDGKLLRAIALEFNVPAYFVAYNVYRYYTDNATPFWN